MRQCSDRSHAPVTQYERFPPKRWYSSFGSAVSGKWVSTTVLTPAVCCHFPDFFRCDVFRFLMPNRACLLLGRHRLPAAAFDLPLLPLLYRRHLRNEHVGTFGEFGDSSARKFGQRLPSNSSLTSRISRKFRTFSGGISSLILSGAFTSNSMRVFTPCCDGRPGTPSGKAWLKRRTPSTTIGRVMFPMGIFLNAISAASSGRSRINIKAFTIALSHRLMSLGRSSIIFSVARKP